MYICKECGHYVFERIEITEEITSPIIVDRFGGIQSINDIKVKKVTWYRCKDCGNSGIELNIIAKDHKEGK